MYRVLRHEGRGSCYYAPIPDPLQAALPERDKVRRC